jgi:hypothetical protein
VADRQTKPCKLCGRPIFWDHGFKKRNLREHEYACASMTKEQREAANAAFSRAPLRPRKRKRKTKNQLELSFGDEETAP